MSRRYLAVAAEVLVMFWQVLRLRATVLLARLGTGVLLLVAVFFLAQVVGSCGGDGEKGPAAAPGSTASEPSPQVPGISAADPADPADPLTSAGTRGTNPPEPAASEPAAAVSWWLAAGHLAVAWGTRAAAVAAWLWQRAVGSGPGNLALGLFCLWLAGRFYLYDRYTQRSLDGLPAGPAAARPRLLQSQEGLVDELTRIVLSDGVDEAPRLIALKGGWGSGKSFLLQVFRRRLETDGDLSGKAVVVHVDIWRHSTERDLHLALFEALLSHPEVPPFPALLRYPMTLVPVLWLRYFSRVLHGGRFEVSGLKVALTLPVLLWQKSLEHAVAVTRRRGRRVVWILDEIDRCSPELAQGAVALARRALSLPGSIVILPFVPEQLRYKVFNPLRLSRPDLDSTLQALIFDYATGVDPSRPMLEALQMKKLLQGLPPVRRPGAARRSGAGEEANAADAELLPGLEEVFAWRLACWFGEASAGVRDRLAYLFEEKYLSMVLPIPKLGLEDAVEMVEVFPTLRPYFEQFLSRNGLADVNREALRRGLTAALRKYLDRPGAEEKRQPVPMIRHLEGELLLQLRDLAQAPSALVDQAPNGFDGRAYARTALATALILAFRRSWELVRKREGGRAAGKEDEHG